MRLLLENTKNTARREKERERERELDQNNTKPRFNSLPSFFRWGRILRQSSQSSSFDFYGHSVTADEFPAVFISLPTAQRMKIMDVFPSVCILYGLQFEKICQ